MKYLWLASTKDGSYQLASDREGIMIVKLTNNRKSEYQIISVDNEKLKRYWLRELLKYVYKHRNNYTGEILDETIFKKNKLLEVLTNDTKWHII